MTNLTWIFLSIFAGLSDIGFNYYSRHLLKDKETAVSMTWWFSSARMLIFLPLFLKDIRLATDLNNHIFLLIIGAVNTLNVYLFMLMHVNTHLSVSTILVRLRIIFVPLLSALILGEILVFKDYIGIIIIFIAVAIVSAPQKQILDNKYLYALIFSFTTSVITILMKILSNLTPTHTIIFAMSLPTVVLLPFMTKKPKDLVVNLTKNLYLKAIVTLFSILLVYLLVWAFEYGGPVAKVNAIFQSMAIFSVPLGIIFLKESDSLREKILGSILAILGIALLV
ncbi:hypothetical protein A2715_02860 [Candidatus Woesebacteria bacterium RIFCSPHIGHO2_01_FULL_39_32]|uniref:EamA domain-containing protein n=1 Tax=Candidatus Woesebacteria bacterium RIFCSPLOWO2_01_FULL_39_25 TaxID=1802521 RepID=A0A1F8BK31_9BACT|nr:MAG: hypothetical protein A2124_02495 [Candidatus Woesebacteria bacterium GWB1_37_5]OGM24093.1 MAG: hypothetical protein A2715_02860 [Candidatus Woesebacteria bacterium RIFCSPHIGHO2_01_FULL_39_32]OGM37928.1 MAG: hypothetical protein A3F01_02900 [Candidatus Woesebacteria bacterium RIFCSPHIGHO2_12_FULL_38_11]OGM64436.1 MAG: hypothetical protein A2893_01035 [Candidatus Woesebacteria bacterium RIFCSPLOWO2_01_FULL_39_25]